MLKVSDVEDRSLLISKYKVTSALTTSFINDLIIPEYHVSCSILLCNAVMVQCEQKKRPNINVFFNYYIYLSDPT